MQQCDTAATLALFRSLRVSLSLPPQDLCIYSWIPFLHLNLPIFWMGHCLLQKVFSLTKLLYAFWGSYIIFYLSEKCEKMLTQSCLTLCDDMDSSLSGSSVHGILQARIVERVTIPFFRGFSLPRDWIRVSHMTGRFFISEPPGKPQPQCSWSNKQSHSCGQ